MTRGAHRLDLPVLLSDYPCVREIAAERLRDKLSHSGGVLSVRVEKDEADPAQAVVHLVYDPNVVSLTGIRETACRTGAEVRDAAFDRALLRVRGLKNPYRKRLIERDLAAMDGVLSVSASCPADALRVEFDPKRIKLSAIVEMLRQRRARVMEPPAPLTPDVVGEETPVEKKEHRHNHDHSHAHDHRRDEDEGFWGRYGELAESLFCGLLLLIGWLMQVAGWQESGLVVLAISAIVGGRDVAMDSLRSLSKLKLDIHVLMVVAAIGAAALGHWAESALLMFLFSLGHAGEHLAMDRARSAIRGLQELAPETAWRLRPDGSSEEIPVEDLSPGDLILAKPGDRVAADGAVTEGTSAVDQAPITGESIPVEKEPGSEVFAGTINGNGVLKIRVSRLASETTLARAVRLVEEAQAEKSPTEIFTDKVNRYYAPSVMGATVLAIFIPPLVFGADWAEWFYRAMAFVTGAAPCALAIGTPAAVLSGLARGARGGVLIKGGAHLEQLGRVKAIALDKTGTLTIGHPEVAEVGPLNGETEESLLSLAASIAGASNHPLSQSIVRTARQQKLQPVDVTDAAQLQGLGVRAKLNGETVEIGSPKMFANDETPEVRDLADKFRARGEAVVVVRRGGKFAGVIALADRLRPEAREALDALRRAGVQKVVMLTGDHAEAARAIAEQAGVDEFFADLLPERKLDKIRELDKAFGGVAMVGDGVNDAPALAQATVGIAMGAAGTDIALEAADVALMGDDLSLLPFAVELSRRARRIIGQNLLIALGTIVFLAPCALLGIAPIGWAVLFHEGSTVVVVLNSLRLLGGPGANKDRNSAKRALSDPKTPLSADAAA
jgi:Cd2+/Zn2+-exporting ATPase